MLKPLVALFKKPSAKVMAQQELEEAERHLLQHPTTKNGGVSQ